MAIYGSGTIISVDGNGNMIVNVGGTDRLTYDFVNGTLREPSHVWAQLSSGFGQDVGGIGQNYLDPCTINGLSDLEIAKAIKEERTVITDRNKLVELSNEPAMAD
jgi:hypothetical protein